MKKFSTILKISLFSALFMSCSTYYLSSYYEDDGIYDDDDYCWLHHLVLWLAGYNLLPDRIILHGSQSKL